MRAVQVQSEQALEGSPFSVTNPATSAALKCTTGHAVPTTAAPGQILIQVKAASIIRDSLTWPETYHKENAVLGNDFSGTVLSVHNHNSDSKSIEGGQHDFKQGDEVYGMTDAWRPGTWADYAVVTIHETALKPKKLSWEDAAAIPLSALTAYQALKKAGLDISGISGAAQPLVVATENNDHQKDMVLITGASGAVGSLIVQLANLAGYHVVAATRSRTRSLEQLKTLGAEEVVEYGDLDLGHNTKYRAVIDTIGGITLEKSWSLVGEGGAIVSIDSFSVDFVEQHKKKGITKDVTAVFFIVEPSSEDLSAITNLINQNRLKTTSPTTYPLEEAKEAYDACHGTSGHPKAGGKIVLIM